VEIDGETQTLPMSAVRNLAFAADRELRRRAYDAELASWEKVAVPLAAAMNGVKGEVATLARRRGWDSPLEAALFDNGIDRPTLDAMLEAAWAAFPDFRRYLKAKARGLGLERLAWYDLFAPMGGGDLHWTYAEAEQFIAAQFHSYSARLGNLAGRAFAEKWIDAEPRDGKVDGGFCMHLRAGESRILMNYTPSYKSLNVLAHELGHAYHDHVLARRSALQRQYPMTLAETASIFCETLVRQAALPTVPAPKQLNILETSLSDACQVVVDITSRFLFEQVVFEGRAARELSVAELKALMVDAQRQTYGDGLDASFLHPYMWAVKPHYYGASFYNFPYMFGLLFGLGLYARYLEDAASFKAGYDDLLSSTSLDSAANLAARFGINIRAVAFWRSSFDVLRVDIDRFETLVNSLER
jgi:pepF/M3 family oligoendopeptidase